MLEVVYCCQIEQAFGMFSCCDSCHEDVEYDFELCEKEVVINGVTKYAIVCCAGLRKIEEAAHGTSGATSTPTNGS